VGVSGVVGAGFVVGLAGVTTVVGVSAGEVEVGAA
jgi:hypothetical protein